jgi:hypothetical protein
MHQRPQYAQVDSPRRHGGGGHAGGGQHMMEQTRYNDIMRSINNTEQFIKAKQAMAAQERGKAVGRNAKKNLHLTEIHAVANSTGSSLMQTQYSKSPFEQPLAGAPAGPNAANKMGRQSKLKVKLGNVHQSTERAPRAEEMGVGNGKPPVRHKHHQTKYPKHLHGSQDQFSGHHNLRETLQKFNQFNKGGRLDQSLQFAPSSDFNTDSSHAQLHIPKITSPNAAMNQSIANMDGMKNSNSVRYNDPFAPSRPQH